VDEEVKRAGDEGAADLGDEEGAEAADVQGIVRLRRNLSSPNDHRIFARVVRSAY